MKVYIAGPLCNQKERNFVEQLDKLCKKLDIETFLPHRDVGLWKEGVKLKEIAKEDLKGFENCDILIANLNGFNIGAGTAWEMGYAFAKRIPIIAIKTDKAPKKSIEEISAIISGLTKITTSFEELENEIKKLIKN